MNVNILNYTMLQNTMQLPFNVKLNIQHTTNNMFITSKNNEDVLFSKSKSGSWTIKQLQHITHNTYICQILFNEDRYLLSSSLFTLGTNSGEAKWIVEFHNENTITLHPINNSLEALKNNNALEGDLVQLDSEKWKLELVVAVEPVKALYNNITAKLGFDSHLYKQKINEAYHYFD